MTDSVTWVFNHFLLFWEDECGRLRYYCPRWIERVRLPKSYNVSLYSCSTCGQQYGDNRRYGQPTVLRCRDCDLKIQAQRQWERRLKARARHIPKVCENCKAEMSAQRRSKRYCSTKCRVNALRKRRTEASPDRHSPGIVHIDTKIGERPITEMGRAGQAGPVLGACAGGD
jgi:hypothetical protein